MLKLLPNQYQAAAIPKQNFYAVSALGPEHDQCSVKRILAKAGGGQGGQTMRATAKIHRPRRQHDSHAGRDRDHEAAARTARSTAVSVLVSTSPATRILAPPVSISISGVRDGANVEAGGAGILAASTMGTKAGVMAGALLGMALTAARRQVKTWLEQICQRRAICEITAPGSIASATTCIFCSSDQRRRRPGPVRTSTRRKTPLASSLKSVITSVPSLLTLQNRESHPVSNGKNGRRAPLTMNRRKAPIRLIRHKQG